jgi:hypothetical protein
MISTMSSPKKLSRRVMLARISDGSSSNATKTA